MLEQLQAYANSRKGPSGCKMADTMRKLDADDQEILAKALDSDSDFSTNALWRGLRDAGLDIGYQTVYRHRNGTCACGLERA